jgi:hypothetical protein
MGDAVGINPAAPIELDLQAVQSARALVRTRSLAEFRRDVEHCHGEFLEGLSLPAPSPTA